jgi:hypothetical protein
VHEVGFHLLLEIDVEYLELALGSESEDPFFRVHDGAFRADGSSDNIASIVEVDYDDCLLPVDL